MSESLNQGFAGMKD